MDSIDKKLDEILGRILRLEATIINLGGLYTGMFKNWEDYLYDFKKRTAQIDETS
jgi:hypothetical protein